MTTSEIIEARRWMCGRMARALRAEHASATVRLGIDAHRGLRTVYDQSSYRKAWMIDGHLAGLGGVTGSVLSPTGFVWLALTERATRYPVQAVKEIRRQLDVILETKSRLVTEVAEGDAAAKRLAAFLGFGVIGQPEGAPAETIHGRRRLIDFMDHEESIRLPSGSGYIIPLAYGGA